MPLPGHGHKTSGYSLTEVMISLGIITIVVAGMSQVYQRLVAGHIHANYRADAAELTNLIRRSTDCGATIAAATCDGVTPVKIFKLGGGYVVNAPPQNTVGKLTVKAVCLNSALQVSASKPGEKDPLTGALLSFTVISANARFCSQTVNLATLVLTPMVFADTGTPCATSGLVSEVYATTSQCKPGYQAIGASPNCEMPASDGLPNSGGVIQALYPVVTAGKAPTAWNASCCVNVTPGGPVLQDHNTVCVAVPRSGNLNNQ